MSGHGRLVAATGALIHIHRDAAARLRPRALRRRLGAPARPAHGPRDPHPRPPPGAHRVRARSTALAAASPGPCSPATACSSATSRGPTSRWTSARAPAASSTRSTDKLMTLPDTCEVWPGHLGGSLCGGPGMDLKVSSTIGFERANQPLLQVRGRGRVRARGRTSALGPQPPNFQNIVALNRGPLVKDTVEAHPLTPRQVQQAERDGALVVDVRTELQFDEAHIPGAVCITARRGGLRIEARVAGRARPAARARGARRRGRPRGRRARERGWPQQRRRATSPAA